MIKDLGRILRYWKTNKSEQGLETMARALGIAPQSLKRYLYELQRRGQIRASEYREYIQAKDSLPSDQEMLSYLESKGYQLVKRAIPSDTITNIPLDDVLSAQDTIKLGIVSDTHLGSKYQQLRYLHAAYEWFKSEGVRRVLHAGDLTDGNGKIYKGHIYEVFLHGGDEVVKYVIDKYPKIDGITTDVIGGNHDESFTASEGISILKLISEHRKDIVYHGPDYAHIQIGNCRISLLHPSGGAPYARSYRAQRIIEQLPGGEKPNVLIIGHLHTTDILPIYRNVLAIQAGCFQAQTPYLARKGLAPDICAFILTLYLNERGIARSSLDWLPFYIPVKNDF